MVLNTLDLKQKTPMDLFYNPTGDFDFRTGKFAICILVSLGPYGLSYKAQGM
jgi:hypothetical protein